jgi:6-phosphogluconolactonase
MQIGFAALVRGFFVAAFAVMATAAGAATYVYVGNAGSNEIIVLSLNPQNGELTEVEKIVVPGITKAGGSIPMAVSPDKKILYAGFRGEPQAVAAFAIDGKSGKLKHLGNGPLADSMPYIVTDRSGKFLLSASYPGHKVTVNPIGADGVVQAPKHILPTPPNAHAILPDASNRHVLVPSLGGDILLQFKFDPASGALSANEPAGARVKEKAGPRHFRFSKDEKFIYLLNELDATVYVLPYDGKTGLAGKELQVISALPAGFTGKPWAAEIQLTPDGGYLYASERTSSTLTGFKVDAKTGMLTLVGNFPTEQQPRAFAIDPSGRYLYAVGEKSDSMTGYAIDAATGKLNRLRQYGMGKSPNWVEIIDLP